jgi:hypothetical protein
VLHDPVHCGEQCRKQYGWEEGHPDGVDCAPTPKQETRKKPAWL